MVAEERSSLPTPDPRTTRARPAQAAATSTLRPLATTPVQPTISSSNEPTLQPTEPPTDQLSDQPSDTVPDQPATQPSVQNVTQSTTSRSGSRPVPPVVQSSNPMPEHLPTRHRRRSESPAAPEDGEYQSTRRRTGLTQPEPAMTDCSSSIETQPDNQLRPTSTVNYQPPKKLATYRTSHEPTRSQPPAPLATFTGENVINWLEDVQDVVFGIWKLIESDWLTRITTHLGPQPKEFFRTKLKGKPWGHVSQALREAYNSPLHQARLLHELECTRQHPDELFTIYVERVRALARRIDSNMQERELRTHIKKGIRQPEFQKEFIKGSLKPLELLCEEISMLEAVEFETARLQPGNRKPIFQVQEPPNPNDNNHQVFQLQTPGGQGEATNPQSFNPRRTQFRAGIFCHSCKLEGHMREDCNKRKVCTNCGGRYHLAPECKKPARPENAGLTGSNAVIQGTNEYSRMPPLPPPPANGNADSRKEPMFHIKNSNSSLAFHIPVTMNGCIIEALVDSGSSVCTCHPALLRKGQLTPKVGSPLMVTNEQTIVPLGTAN